MKAEWKKAPDFAEYAEALGIRTTQVMAAQLGETTVVLYTPELDEDDLDPETPLVAAWLVRDGDGIPRVIERRLLEGFDWSQLEADIAQRLAELER